MSSIEGPPPTSGDVDLGPRLVAIFLTLSILAFLAVVLRLWLRIRDRHLGMDDFCAFVAAVTFVCLSADVSYSAAHGTYRHQYYLTEDQSELALKTNTILQLLIGISLAFGKVAVALLLLRLMGLAFRWLRWFLWSLIVATFLICIITFFVTLFQCRNPQAIWNVSLRMTTSCLDPSVITNEAIAVSAWYTADDFILALVPIIIIRKLQMSLGKKVAWMFLLGLGIITGIFGALKTSQVPVLAHDSDASFEQFNLQVFGGIENFLVIVLGCVPIFKRPLEDFFLYAFRRWPVGLLRRIYGHSSKDGRDDIILPNNGYIRHEESADPLQIRVETDILVGRTANGSPAYPDWQGEPVSREISAREHKAEIIFQSV